MSDGMREWRFYVDDMIVFGGKVLTYTAGMDQSAFVANTLVFDVTLRNLERTTWNARCDRFRWDAGTGCSAGPRSAPGTPASCKA